MLSNASNAHCVTEPVSDTGQAAYDWIEPWRNLAKLLNIVLCHALGVLAITGVAEGLEYAIEFVSRQPLAWAMRGLSVSLCDIICNFDLIIFAVFLYVALVDIVKWALRR